MARFELHVFELPFDFEQENVLFTENPNKKALLIGINYSEDTNKRDDLNGCENDMYRLQNWIIDNCNFEKSQTTTLDSADSTKENILSHYILFTIHFFCL